MTRRSSPAAEPEEIDVFATIIDKVLAQLDNQPEALPYR